MTQTRKSIKVLEISAVVSKGHRQGRALKY